MMAVVHACLFLVFGGHAGRSGRDPTSGCHQTKGVNGWEAPGQSEKLLKRRAGEKFCGCTGIAIHVVLNGAGRGFFCTFVSDCCRHLIALAPSQGGPFWSLVALACLLL